MHPHPTCLVVADHHALRLFRRGKRGARLLEQLDATDSADFVEHEEYPSQGLRRVAGRTMVKPKRERGREELAIFLRRAAGQIDRAVVAQGARSLALCAPADVLSDIRDYIASGTRKLLVFEMCQDLVGKSAAEIDAIMRQNGM